MRHGTTLTWHAALCRAMSRLAARPCSYALGREGTVSTLPPSTARLPYWAVQYKAVLFPIHTGKGSGMHPHPFLWDAFLPPQF